MIANAVINCLCAALNPKPEIHGSLFAVLIQGPARELLRVSTICPSCLTAGLSAFKVCRFAISVRFYSRVEGVLGDSLNSGESTDRTVFVTSRPG